MTERIIVGSDGRKYITTEPKPISTQETLKRKDALLRQALDALEEATTYTSSPSWSPSMTRECECVIAAIKGELE